MDQEEIKRELTRCWLSPVYFTEKYVRIYNATIRDWIPFEMWPAQREALGQIMTSQYVIVLKARQLGMSWLCLSFALWLMLFRPIANIMIMSKRDEETVDLLTNRLSKMHSLLPEWMQATGRRTRPAHDFVLSNGSRAKAFPTSGGRSYTGTFVLLDEADFVPSLSEVLNAIKPAVDAGGQLVLISTVDKAVPLRTFKQLFRSAYYDRSSNYTPIFFSWRARPDRTDEWYQAGGGRYVPAESRQRRPVPRVSGNAGAGPRPTPARQDESRSIGCRPAGPMRFHSRARICLGCPIWRCMCARSLGAAT